MLRSRLSFAVLLVVLSTVLVSCTDRAAPTEATAAAVSRRSGLASCMSLSELNLKIVAVFGSSASKMPNTNSALHKLDLINKKLQKGTAVDTADAQTHTRDLIDFIRQKAYELADQSQVQALIAGLECYAGITNDTFLLMPEDNVTTFISGSGTAGIQFPATSVDFPTLITLTELPATSSGVLVTKLDKYPGFIEITQQSADPDGNSLKLTQSVTVEVCPVGVPTAEIRGRLRLGHQRAPGASGFDITPPTTASLLNCSTVVGSAASKLPGWMRSLASLVMPKPLYARVMFSGGVGGTAEEFSPFGPVDPVLSFSGGVGGTAEEFIREQPTTPAPAKKQPSTTEESVKAKTSVRSTVAETAVNIITCYQAVVGASAKATGCRPQVTLTTANLLTPFVGVPVTFTVGTLGGSVAADAGSACGVLGSSVTVLTDVNGVARACWTLGDIAGDYTVTATPGNGGDAIAGVSFSLASYTWTTTALKKTATIGLDNLAQTYTGSPLGVTTTTTPADLNTVHVTYDAGTTVPTNAGSYAVVATLDNPTYQGTTSGTLVIAKGTQSISFSALSARTFGDADFTVDATASSGLAVSFIASGNCTGTGTTVSITGAGSCTVTAQQGGNGNFLAAADVGQSFTIGKATAPVTLGGLTATYSGSPIGASVTTSATGSSSFAVTYDGSTDVPVNAGSYSVIATLNNANFSGSTTGTLVIGKATAGVSLNGLTAIYDGAAKSATATTSPSGLGTIGFTYNGSDTAPSNAGSYAVLATLANANYAGGASGTLVISPAGTTITWANPATIILGTPLTGTQLNAYSPSTTGTFAYTPPAGTVLSAGTSTLSTLFTPSTANYSANSASVSIKVFYKQAGCFSSPVYSVMPDTKSYQRKGSNLQIKCQLTNVSGVGVMNATGNLKIEDLGLNGSTPTGTPLDIPNAFKVSTSGNYAYGLDTSPANFISLHYYRVTAFWNDGNTTVGWFYIK